MKTRLLKRKSIFFIFALCLTMTLFILSVGTSSAWWVRSCVYCDLDDSGKGHLNYGDLALPNVLVNIDSTTSTFGTSAITGDNGCMWVSMPDVTDSYSETLDSATIPDDTAYIIPPSGEFLFDLTDTNYAAYHDWLIDSDICREQEQPSGCRVTGGGNDTSGIAIGGGWDGTMADAKNGNGNGNVNRYTFGGQAGANTGAQPQPKGEWTHHQQRGPDGSFVFHAGTASAPTGTEIDQIICSDDGWCNPAREAPSKQIDFAGIGTFKNIKNPSTPLMNVVPGETYHWFEVHIEDLGEPGKEPVPGKEKKNMICTGDGSGTDAFADPPIFVDADCGCADFYRIRIFEGVIPAFDPGTGEVTNADKTNIIYEVSGYINGGNFQIHPPTGFDLK